MGHAGAFALPAEPSALDKIKALENAGATIINHPSRFGPVIKDLLDGKSASAIPGAGFKARAHGSVGQQQTRGLHTVSRFSSRTRGCLLLQTPKSIQQRRNIILAPETSLQLLQERGLPVAAVTPIAGAQTTLAVTINRSNSSPSILVLPSGSTFDTASRVDFDYSKGSSSISATSVARAIGLSTEAIPSLRRVLDGLVGLFMDKEAYLIETCIVERQAESGGVEVQIVSAKLGFDDAAFRSCKRQGDIQSLRDTASADPAEIEVEKDGIVYIKLAGGDIGTLVNGAGLAMNTVDALADAGGRAANFLDTGGKATSETVKRSFEVILKDKRVKVRLLLLW